MPLSNQSTSRHGRAEGEQLLRLTDSLDSARIAPGGEEANVGLMLVLFIVRARRLVKAIGCLDDCNWGVEAEILNRTLLEHAVTVAWICAKPLERRKRWLLHDARDRLEWDRKYEEKTRPEGGQEGSGERLLTENLRDQLGSRVANLESLGVKGMPKLEQMCDEIGSRDLYHTLYAYWSKGYEHPLVFALERFAAEGTPADGWIIDAHGPSSEGIDPYETAVMNLHWVMDAAARVAPHAFPWRAELDAVAGSLKQRYEPST